MSLATDLSYPTLVVSRRFAASPERLFDAWFDPKAVGAWLFATPGGVSKHVEIDARVGGGFAIHEQRGEILATHFGEYREIVRPRRIVFTFGSSKDGPFSVVTGHQTGRHRKRPHAHASPLARMGVGRRQRARRLGKRSRRIGARDG
jgi:uncharacterized protein YndB with AHSA1/START domain